MPYIKIDRQDLVDGSIPPVNPGDLNFLITHTCHRYIQVKGLCYTTLNEVIGVLECAKASLIETVLVPYEKTKMKENGHISILDQNYYDKL